MYIQECTKQSVLAHNVCQAVDQVKGRAAHDLRVQRERDLLMHHCLFEAVIDAMNVPSRYT
jgi:hypothetical protein